MYTYDVRTAIKTAESKQSSEAMLRCGDDSSGGSSIGSRGCKQMNVHLKIACGMLMR